MIAWWHKRVLNMETPRCASQLFEQESGLLAMKDKSNIYTTKQLQTTLL